MNRILLCCLLLFAPSSIAAQDSPATTSRNSDAARQALLLSLQAFVDSLSAPPGYVREVYRYPRFGRLNPVEPPLTVTSRASFPELRLTGILFDETDPSMSAAILRITKDGIVSRAVVRAGNEIGQYHIVAVEPDHVVIEVTVYGGIRRHTLTRTPNRPAPRRQNP